METIEPQLQKFIDKTNNGNIAWIQVNPNALRWVKTLDGRTVTTTIQAQGGAPGTIAGRNYILTIQSSVIPPVMLQVNSTTDAKYKSLLEKLFEVATLSAKNSSGKFLDDLLDSV